jgi:hypothetical protein
VVAQSYKYCPICNTPNHRNATVCTTCGATLAVVKAASSEAPSAPGRGYAHDFGETDLLESNLRWRGGTYIVGAVVGLVLLACIGLLGLGAFQAMTAAGFIVTPPLAPPTVTPAQGGLATNTARPTLLFATVTPAPPTLSPTPSATITPTQGPCVQRVQPGDSLISVIVRCGHTNLDPIMSTVVVLNDLADASRIQEGQEIQVPWPTPTFDPNAVPTPTPEGQANATPDPNAVVSAGELFLGVELPATATLPAGVQWHTVIRDENVITIGVQYGATVRVLSELNPEINFLQCDFGLDFGGPNCTVLLYEGQRMRVPAPTPTPFMSPTPNGSETPTPTATPTFNVPGAVSPSDRAFFGSGELITLRWTATGTLAPDEVYLVTVEDLTTGEVFTATTTELSFVVPDAWHSQAQSRHDYRWAISIISINQPDNPRYSTEPRQFTWQGRGA